MIKKSKKITTGESITLNVFKCKYKDNKDLQRYIISNYNAK